MLCFLQPDFISCEMYNNFEESTGVRTDDTLLRTSISLGSEARSLICECNFISWFQFEVPWKGETTVVTRQNIRHCTASIPRREVKLRANDPSQLQQRDNGYTSILKALRTDSWTWTRTTWKTCFLLSQYIQKESNASWSRLEYLEMNAIRGFPSCRRCGQRAFPPCCPSVEHLVPKGTFSRWLSAVCGGDFIAVRLQCCSQYEATSRYLQCSRLLTSHPCLI